MANPFAAKVHVAEEDRASILPDDDERSVPSESLSRQGSRLSMSRFGSTRRVSFRQDSGGDSVGGALDRSFRLAQSNFAEAPDVLQDVELGIRKTEDGFWGSEKTYDLAVVNLTYKVMEKKGKELVEKVLLNKVNARATHGEILAVMGPSGSSKTTFLDAIAGRIQRQSLEGAVLVNGNPVDSSFMKVSQYVMQDDALFPLLTVTETLMFSARFRLGSMSNAERLKRVEVIIDQLGLKECASTYVGNDELKGVSGGERRRVSIGVELINDPGAIFLDEPTSGLDSTSALHVVEILSMLAVERKRLVILTIHQPSFRILDLLNKLLILARGNVVYHGRVQHMTKFFEGIGRNIPGNVNVVELALDTIEQYQDDPVGFEKLLAHQKEKHEMDELERISSLRDKKDQLQKPGFGSSFISEILTLSDRTFKNIFRTPELFLSRIGLAIVTALVFGTIFLNANYAEKGARQRQSFLIITIALGIYTTNESLPVFLAERQIFIREVSRGAYRPSTYTLAQALVFTPFLALVALVNIAVSYFMVDLVHNAGAFFICVLTLALTLILANAFVSVFGAIAPNFLVANSITVAIFTFMFLFSGFFIPRSSIPDYWIWLHYLSLFKYPYEIIIWNEFSRLPGRTWYGTTTTQDLLKNYSAGKVHIWNNVAVMVAMIIGYRFIFYLILRFRTNNIRK